MNYSHPTTIYESMLAQLYVFLVLITSNASYRDKK